MELRDAVLFLTAAVVVVPIFKRAGLGAVLGYLAAGVSLGPSGFGLIHEVEDTLHFAELGVVFLMFLVGLELQPARLWKLRAQVFQYGGLQVGLTALVFWPIGWLCGLPPAAAGVVGVALALSSTAFGLQILAERRELAAPHGQAAFGILLFQDIAASPLLAVLPLLGAAASADPQGASSWAPVLIAIGTIAGLVLAGRFVLAPLFRLVMASHVRELSASLALLIVLSTAGLVEHVGLSAALGAFLAGVLLADSPYRHELEADIDPFKGLLLGLFFVAVGMSADLGIVAARPLAVVALVVGMVAIKAAVLYGLGRLVFRLPPRGALTLGLALSQGGEFAFVVGSVAVAAGVFGRDVAGMLVIVVTLSMVTTPLLFLLVDRLTRERSQDERPFDAIDEENPVLIAGAGRVGQIVTRTLRMTRIPFTVLEIDPAHIDFLRKFGSKVFYGDAARVDLLHAARAANARLLVVAVDDPEAALQIVRTARHHFPQLRILARARNRQHVHALRAAGAAWVMRETFGSSLDLARRTLEELDHPSARELVETFREWDERILAEQYAMRDDEKAMIAAARKWNEELERLFETDARQ
ncbi:MAG: cation:proton antiporter [Myxococcales bacterium]|nr:cation:proton antiporter [Myxococcales bacterium]